MIEQSVQPPPAAGDQPPDVAERSGADAQSKFRRPRQRPAESGFRRFVRKYNFEIGWCLVVGLGVFLVVVDPGNLKSTLWLAANELKDGLLAETDRFLGFLGHLRMADLIGGLLIVAAMGALLIRIRWQLMHAPALTTGSCPRCGGVIHRVHRHRLDRAISWYLPVHRYRCSNGECEWGGLRVVSAAKGKPRR